MKAEHEKLKGEASAWEKSFNIEWEQLDHLTAVINDNEVADKVATEEPVSSWCSEGHYAVRRKAIADYRTMLRAE